MTGALKNYHNVNDALPDRIVVFRDGVADGQLETVHEHEVKQLLECFMRVGQDYTYVYMSLSYKQLDCQALHKAKLSVVEILQVFLWLLMYMFSQAKCSSLSVVLLAVKNKQKLVDTAENNTAVTPSLPQYSLTTSAICKLWSTAGSTEQDGNLRKPRFRTCWSSYLECSVEHSPLQFTLFTYFQTSSKTHFYFSFY